MDNMLREKSRTAAFTSSRENNIVKNNDDYSKAPLINSSFSNSMRTLCKYKTTHYPIREPEAQNLFMPKESRISIIGEDGVKSNFARIIGKDGNVNYVPDNPGFKMEDDVKKKLEKIVFPNCNEGRTITNNNELELERDKSSSEGSEDEDSSTETGEVEPVTRVDAFFQKDRKVNDFMLKMKEEVAKLPPIPEHKNFKMQNNMKVIEKKLEEGNLNSRNILKRKGIPVLKTKFDGCFFEPVEHCSDSENGEDCDKYELSPRVASTQKDRIVFIKKKLHDSFKEEFERILNSDSSDTIDFENLFIRIQDYIKYKHSQSTSKAVKKVKFEKNSESESDENKNDDHVHDAHTLDGLRSNTFIFDKSSNQNSSKIPVKVQPVKLVNGKSNDEKTSISKVETLQNSEENQSQEINQYSNIASMMKKYSPSKTTKKVKFELNSESENVLNENDDIKDHSNTTIFEKSLDPNEQNLPGSSFNSSKIPVKLKELHLKKVVNGKSILKFETSQNSKNNEHHEINQCSNVASFYKVVSNEDRSRLMRSISNIESKHADDTRRKCKRRLSASITDNVNERAIKSTNKCCEHVCESEIKGSSSVAFNADNQSMVRPNSVDRREEDLENYKAVCSNNDDEIIEIHRNSTICQKNRSEESETSKFEEYDKQIEFYEKKLRDDEAKKNKKLTTYSFNTKRPCSKKKIVNNEVQQEKEKQSLMNKTVSLQILHIDGLERHNQFQNKWSLLFSWISWLLGIYITRVER